MRVVLIGEQFPESENLALAMLRASLEARGHEVTEVPLGFLTEIDRTAATALRAGARLVGLSINYQSSALTALAVGHRLRMAGYDGHLTAGGAFATLHAAEILRDCPLDSLIVFEGEQPLADLADHLARIGPTDARSAPLPDIPGLVVAGADRAGQEPGLHPQPSSRTAGTSPQGAGWEPALQSSTGWAARPAELPEHLGLPAATLVASRGCQYGCVYCCISALRGQARRHATATGRPAGAVAATRRRPVADVAEEMAHLYHARGARIFRFEDDCLLGRSPDEGRAYVSALRQALARRRVGRIAITLKLRPDSLDAELVRELEALGLVHAFVGIEAMTDGTLQRLGRAYSAHACREALGALEASGVPAYFNALVIGPEATAEGLRRDLDALEGLDAFPFEIVRLILYAHTPLFRRLLRRGAVTGNYLHWRYTFRDPRIEVVARVLERLPTRRTGVYCAAKRLADLEFNLALAGRFYPRADTAAIREEAARLKRDSNRDSVRLVGELLELAEHGPSVDQQLHLAARLAPAINARDAEWFGRIDGLLRQLEQAVSGLGPSRPRAFLRSGLAAAAACVQLAFAPAPSSISGSPGDGSGPAVVAQQHPEPPSGEDGAEGTGAEGTGGAVEPAPAEGDPDTRPTTQPTGEPTGEPTSEPDCKLTVGREDGRSYLSSVAGGNCAVYLCSLVMFKIDADGRVIDVDTTDSFYPEDRLEPGARECLLRALSGVCFPDWSNNAVGVGVSGPCD